MKGLDLIFSPSDNHLSQIKAWLIQEDKEFSEGFYCNWNIIADCFNDNKLYCLTENGKAIGFVCWRTWHKTVTFDIGEIKRDKRGKGYGRLMVEGCIEKFRSEGYLVIDLQCAPPESERVWRKLGFIAYTLNSQEPNQKMYLSLVPTISPTEKTITELKSAIEVWNCEPYQTNNKDSNCRWDVSHLKANRTLMEPIIYPCNYEWRIRYTCNNKVVKDEKVKYFGRTDIHFGDFLIITELPKF